MGGGGEGWERIRKPNTTIKPNLGEFYIYLCVMWLANFLFKVKGLLIKDITAQTAKLELWSISICIFIIGTMHPLTSLQQKLPLLNSAYSQYSCNIVHSEETSDA